MQLSVNLFKKNKDIYLISGDWKYNVNIFDFITTNLLNTMSYFDGYINSLCSFSQKYIIASSGNSIEYIEMEKFYQLQILEKHNNIILGVEKLKIGGKGEHLITYDNT